MFNILRKAIRAFKKDQSGVTAIEYGLIAIIMAAFIIFAFYKNIVPTMEGKIESLNTTIQSVKFDQKLGDATNTAQDAQGSKTVTH
ncbi:Flp family type IVb pilin [Actinobacillus delphinicola]|uniref:Flp operon protein Flp1 n=1 Tax=Actinobacillus delphinicola TaxID=51161 RepID=A0A448TVF2_9PAST|nr:Flp family type IVb pilin [Actinobacillus delphinicola]VEJ09911.1 flp operon protein Flp1 [Actinobacillus delphinicola]